MSKKQWNLRLSKARLSTTISHTKRTELDKVQERFAAVDSALEQSEALALYELICMLPVGCWSINNVRDINSVNLHTHQLHSTPCQFIRSFEGRTWVEVKRKYDEYVEKNEK